MNDVATRPMTTDASAQDFLAGGGEMGARMRRHDWSTSSLGDPGGWPQSLRTAVSLMINSRHPMFIAWGPELAFLYNDGYIPIFGAKHPHTLGRPFRQVWSEIWDDIWPLIERALAGEATWSENLHLVMERNGFPEDTWYTFSYSPIRDESGGVGGMFCACQETTQIIRSEAALRESEDRFRTIFEEANDFIFTIGLDYRLTAVNPATAAAIGIAPEEGVGRSVAEFMSMEDFEASKQRLAAKLQGGQPTRYEIEVTSAAGERMIWEVNSRLNRAPDGRPLGLHVIGRDVTDQRRAEAALRESEARLRNAVQASPFPTMLHAEDGEVLELSRKWTELTGYAREQIRTHFDWVKLAYPGRERDLAALIAAEFAQEGEVAAGEFAVRTSDGSSRIWDFHNARLGRLPDGRRLLVSAASDVTDRKRDEEHLRLLIGELNHRVKNTLAIVQSIARQSLTGAGVAGDVRDRFEGRLQALAAAHNLLTRENWGSADLGDVIRDVTEACHGGAGRFEIEGPTVRLEPKVAVTVAMAVHELCTNAVKYGALANATGRVAVRWSLDDRLRLCWQERGGPPVKPPTRRGFGSRMIERALASELDAKVKLDFRPAGLVVEIVAEFPTRAAS